MPPPNPRRCLTWDTASRITPNDALRHPFFAAARPQVSIAPYVEYPAAYPMAPQVRGCCFVGGHGLVLFNVAC